MTNEERSKSKQSDCRRTNVRFSPEEYDLMRKDELLSGKSIPWLLKSTYLNNRISPPTLSPDEQKAVLRELSMIGNNVNQIAREVNSGLISNVKEDIREVLNRFRMLCSFLGLEYGDRKDSL